MFLKNISSLQKIFMLGAIDLSELNFTEIREGRGKEKKE